MEKGKKREGGKDGRREGFHVRTCSEFQFLYLEHLDD